MKYAVVDLGSNTIRLSLYSTKESGEFQLLFSAKEMAGLASYIHKGVLSKEGILRACGVLTNFKNVLGQFGIQEMHVFATAPLRNIRNTDEAVQAIQKRTGVNVEVLSGVDEAELGYYGALLTCQFTNGAMFDIGGGSTEVLQVRDGHICRAESFPIGSLVLFNQSVSKIWPKRKEMAQMQEKIQEVLRQLDFPEEPMEYVCGIGGTARAVLKLINRSYEYPRDNRIISLGELQEMSNLLTERKREARDLILECCPDRLHVIIPGILWMNTLCKKLSQEKIWISKYGVREGYLCHKLIRPGI